MDTQPGQPLLPRPVAVLVGIAAACVALGALYAARDILAPLALAAVIVIICHPIRFPLEKRGWPSWAATTAVVAVAYAVLLALAALLFFSGVEFARLVMELSDQIAAFSRDTMQLVKDLGFESQLAEAITAFTNPNTLLSFATSLSGSVITVVTVLLFVFAYVIFMAADGSRYSRAIKLYGPASSNVMRRMRFFNASVRRYYVVNAVFGALVAIIDGLALWALGIPAPIVWAILSFVTNFIPNIGFVLGLIPPVVLALVVGGWPLMLAVLAIYSIANAVLQALIQPKFVSDAVSLSLTLSFFSVIFWTFIIGPLGAILSIPLTLLVRALLFEGDGTATWLRWLSGDDSAHQRTTTPSRRPGRAPGS